MICMSDCQVLAGTFQSSVLADEETAMGTMFSGLKDVNFCPDTAVLA